MYPNNSYSDTLTSQGVASLYPGLCAHWTFSPLYKVTQGTWLFTPNRIPYKMFKCSNVHWYHFSTYRRVHYYIRDTPPNGATNTGNININYDPPKVGRGGKRWGAWNVKTSYIYNVRAYLYVEKWYQWTFEHLNIL